MTNLTQQTVNIIGNIRNLDSNMEELIRRFKSMSDRLEGVVHVLLISKQLCTKLDELHDCLGATEKALTEFLNEPYIGNVVAVSVKAVVQIKEIVAFAKKRVCDLEIKIKAHREKLEEFKAYIDEIVKVLRAVEEFLKKEGQLVDATYKMNNKLPESRYKNLSQERLNNSSELQNELLLLPNKVVDKVNGLLPQINSMISEIVKLCNIAERVFEPIQDIIIEINQIANVTKEINIELQRVLSISYTGGKTEMPVREILSATGIIPGINSLTISTVEILEPLLKKLEVKVDKIPGLDLSLGNLEKVIEKSKYIERLKNEIIRAMIIFINDNNPKKTFEQVEKGN